MSNKIKVRNLTKDYSVGLLALFSRNRKEKREALALDNVTLNIEQGERVGIIGENGAGKSTLLKILAGISKQSSGVVDINGKVHAILSLGLGLKEELSGRDNIYLDAQMQGKSKGYVNEKIEEIVEFCELGEFIDRPVRTYSSGMKARLTFGCLAFVEPEILVIDEALSVGDVFFAEKANILMRKLCRSGSIVIIVSHGMETIKTMCSRCIWLDSGKMVMDGEPATVIKQYNQFVNDRETINFREPGSVITQEKNSQTLRAPFGLYSQIAEDAPKLEKEVYGTSDHLYLDIKTIEDCTKTLKVSISLERLDGYLVTTNEFSVETTGTCLSFDIGKVCFRPSIYKLMVSITSDESANTQWQKTFKVKSENNAFGGVPALNWPCEVKMLEMRKTQDTVVA